MRKVISKDGTTIAFDRSGEGAPIILVGRRDSGGFITICAKGQRLQQAIES